VTEAQLYRYFGSKSGLFREVVFKPLYRQLVAQIYDAGMPQGLAASIAWPRISNTGHRS
jgi:hypothetical protein